MSLISIVYTKVLRISAYQIKVDKQLHLSVKLETL